MSTPKRLVEFSVLVTTRPWESVYVVGNLPELGLWDPINALPLNITSNCLSSEFKNFKSVGELTIWKGHLNAPEDHELQYRYFVCQFLDPNKDINETRMIVNRWETVRKPRCLIPKLDSCMGQEPDTFGSYAGRTLVSEGWLLNQYQTEIRLRFHGMALKFFKTRHQNRVYRIKATPIDLRFKEVYNYDRKLQLHGSEFRLKQWRALTLFNVNSTDLDDEFDGDNEDSREPGHQPTLPSYTQTELSILSSKEPSFHEQLTAGEVFRNDEDYFVFRTQSMCVEFLAFRLELFVLPDDQCTVRRATDLDDVTLSINSQSPSCAVVAAAVHRVAICYILPSSMQDTFGKSMIPIFDKIQQPIGQIIVDYLFIHPLNSSGPKQTMQVSYNRHWKKRQTLEVGHRGMGKSYTKFSAVRENTIHSLNSAAYKGADLVEFDVQLTKDKVPRCHFADDTCPFPPGAGDIPRFPRVGVRGQAILVVA